MPAANTISPPSGSLSKYAFVLEPIDLMEFKAIVSSKLGITFSHIVDERQLIVEQVAVAGLDGMGHLCLKLAGAMSR